MDEIEFMAVVATTDLLQGLTDPLTAIETANAINKSAGMSSIIVDLDDHSARMATSAIAHPGVIDYRVRFSVAAAYQAAEAHSMIETITASLGGSPAVSEPPTNGPRLHPDEMLEVIDHIPLRDEPVPLHKEDFEEALVSVPTPRDFSLVVEGNATDHGLVVEFPFYHATPAMYLDLRDPDAYAGTALLTLSVRDSIADAYWNSATDRIGSPPMTPRHSGAFTRYGTGLHVRLGLPVIIEEEAAVRLAAELNELEADRSSRNSLFGSWYGESEGLWFTAYYPNLLIAPQSHEGQIALLWDLVISYGARTQWARSVLEDRIPHPGS